MNRTLSGSIETIRERCRVCYTCVRECPAKAIRINDGQAEVLANRCIGCGNCVRVCSQKAKRVVDSLDLVRGLLVEHGVPTAALLAPSFPAEFVEIDHERVVGMVRRLAFSEVYEVGFGADLVARRYRELVEAGDARPYIASTCPAVVLYVAKFQPQLVDQLSPIVSPMVAMARVVRHINRGRPVHLVFIGPCIAKKCEAVDECVPNEVDAVLTFAELRAMFAQDGLKPEGVEPSEFDPPHAGLGALFSLSRGLLQAADMAEDLLAKDVIATDGRTNFVDALKAFEAGTLETHLLEVLACEGCIMGAGMTCSASLFQRRTRVSDYVRRRLTGFDKNAWRRDLHRFIRHVDLRREFAPSDQRSPAPTEGELVDILRRMGKECAEDELNCGACGYDTCREHAVAIHKRLAESEMCLPYTIEKMRLALKALALSHEQLISTQQALMQSEKLASMGQLAAGIAHEVNNPLGVVLLYAHALLDECPSEAQNRKDLELVVEQADRCKRIVAGLLQFARQNRVLREHTDARELMEKAARSCTIPDNVTVTSENACEDPCADLDADQIVQVLVNMTTNACAAMPQGGRLTLRLEGDGDRIRFVISDTGHGIPEGIRDKIFEPFFTTKQIGMGTGLGLAVVYGIVKMHSGDIAMHTNCDLAKGPTGTVFTITIPRKEAHP